MGENLFRHNDAQYFLPSEDEWHKAAFYDGSGIYFDYATGSDTAPAPAASGTTPGTAVYDQLLGQGPADIINAGGLGPYGTMAQNGNVSEWLESAFFAPNDSPGEQRVHRGGSWAEDALSLPSSGRGILDPTLNGGGFRVAAVARPIPGESNADEMLNAFENSMQLAPLLAMRPAASTIITLIPDSQGAI